MTRPDLIHLLGTIEQGNLQDATSQCRHLIGQLMINHGAHHPDTLLCQSLYGMILTMAGQYEHAFDMISHTYAKCLVHLGEGHFSTLYTLYRYFVLTAYLHYDDITIQLGPMLYSLFTIYDSKAVHHLKAGVDYYMALAYAGSGNNRRAEELLRSLLMVWGQVYGPTASNTLAARHMLGQVLVLSGNFCAAREEYSRLISDLPTSFSETRTIWNEFLSIGGRLCAANRLARPTCLMAGGRRWNARTGLPSSSSHQVTIEGRLLAE